MIPMTLDEIADVVGGEVVGDPTVTVTGPAFRDDREPVAGGLFVAIVGRTRRRPRLRGAAVEGGAVAVLGSRPTDAPTVVVDDVVVALGRAGAARGRRGAADRPRPHRLAGQDRHQGLPRPGAGRPSAPTVATAGNLNNELGVPLTVLQARPTPSTSSSRWARAASATSPSCAGSPRPTSPPCSTSAPPTSDEFGSREAIAQAKGEIVEALRPEGTAVLNADDDLVSAMSDRTRARVLTFGEHGPTWPGATSSSTTWVARRSSWDTRGEWHPCRCDSPAPTRSPNAVAAAAMALATDRSTSAWTRPRSPRRSRPRCPPRGGGWSCTSGPTAWWWSTTPTTPTRPRWSPPSTPWWPSAGAGGRARSPSSASMLELGAVHDAEHERIGRYAAERGVDVVVAVGPDATGIAAGRGRRTTVERESPRPRWGVPRPWTGCGTMQSPVMSSS